MKCQEKIYDLIFTILTLTVNSWSHRIKYRPQKMKALINIYQAENNFNPMETVSKKKRLTV